MEPFRKAFFAILGAGDLAVEGARGLPGKARKLLARRDEVAKLFGDLVRRGERAGRRIVRSAPAKRAAAQTRQARKRLEGAVTTLRGSAGPAPRRARATRKAS